MLRRNHFLESHGVWLHPKVVRYHAPFPLGQGIRTRLPWSGSGFKKKHERFSLLIAEGHSSRVTPTLIILPSI